LMAFTAAAVNAIKALHTEGLTVRSLQEYHADGAEARTSKVEADTETRTS